MTVDRLRQAFELLAQRLDTRLRHFADRPANVCIDLQSILLNEGYLRLCLDEDDALVIVEIAIPFASLVPRTAPALDKLLALQFVAGSSQDGRRFFPALDARNDHLILSHAAGIANLRTEHDLLAFAQECARESAAMINTATMLGQR